MSRLSVILALSVIQLLSVILGATVDRWSGTAFSSSVMSAARVLSSVMSAMEMSSLMWLVSLAEAGILRALGLLVPGRDFELLHLKSNE